MNKSYLYMSLKKNYYYFLDCTFNVFCSFYKTSFETVTERLTIFLNCNVCNVLKRMFRNPDNIYDENVCLKGFLTLFCQHFLQNGCNVWERMLAKTGKPFWPCWKFENLPGNWGVEGCPIYWNWIPLKNCPTF